MPLFGRKQEPVPAQQAPVSTHPTSHSRFGRTSTSSRGSPTSTGRRSGGGLFSRRRSSSVSSMSSADMGTNRKSHGTGILHRNRHEDPSIVAARERVVAAERAERDADMALQQARVSVREARDHVKRLELEAEAEAKAAKLKQGQAKDLGRRAKPLGRHG